MGLLTLATGQANLVTIVNFKTRAELPQIHSELVSLCPSLQLRETQICTRAVKLHTRWLTPDDQWTDDVTDPLWALRANLTRV